MTAAWLTLLLMTQAPADAAQAPSPSENAVAEAVPSPAPAPETPSSPKAAAGWAAAGTLASVGALGALTAGTLAFVEGGLMLTLLPLFFAGNPAACACLLLGFIPAQCVVLGATGVAAPLLGAPSAYAAARSKGKRRVPLIPLLLGVAVPTVVGLTLSGVMTVAGVLSTCMCLCCTFSGYLSYLQDNYKWSGVAAEYYIERRISPPILYAGLAVTQLLVLLPMLAGTGMSAALVAAATMNTGREVRPSDPVAPDWTEPEAL